MTPVKSPMKTKPAKKSVPARDGLAKFAKSVNKRLGG